MTPPPIPRSFEAFQDHAASDSRIRLTRREQPGGISTATNAALEHASGRYIALLDHDDTLHPHALQHIVDQLSADPHLDMIYTDEAVVADGQRVAAHLKPDWSPENICALMYTNHQACTGGSSRERSAASARTSTAARTTTSCCG